MIPHQAVGVTESAIALSDLTQHHEEGFAAHVIFENGLAGIAAGGDVIEGAGVFGAQGAGHGRSVTQDTDGSRTFLRETEKQLCDSHACTKKRSISDW